MTTWLKSIFQHWKTTSAGLVMIGGSIVHLVFALREKTANENTWTITITGILGGLGLIFAGDASESATKQEVATAIKTGNTDMLTKSDTTKG